MRYTINYAAMFLCAAACIATGLRYEILGTDVRFPVWTRGFYLFIAIRPILQST